MEYRCAICGRSDSALLEAYHREKGAMLVCPRCWEELVSRNELVPSGGGGGCPCG